jgi:3alpha(or 20beta)-hydroxysteroid dehydrogenase
MAEIRGKKLSEKVAIVTGGASGIGEATVRLLHDEGATVVIADINFEAATKLAAAIGHDAVVCVGQEVIACQLDVSQEQEWTACVDDVVSRYGQVDILVNNAGIGTGGAVIDEPIEGHRRALDVNVTGVWLGMRAVLPAMYQQQSGSIVNISSIDGLVGIAQLTTYTATKFAVTGMTKSVALEVGSKGVRVNSVHPGFISTPLFNKPSPGKSQRYEEAIARQPIARAGTPQEVAKAILFFASDDSSFCTGTSLVVDGGHTAGPYRTPLA